MRNEIYQTDWQNRNRLKLRSKLNKNKKTTTHCVTIEEKIEILHDTSKSKKLNLLVNRNEKHKNLI